MKAGLCDESDIGSFILAENATEKARSGLVSTAVHLKDPKPIKYPIKSTGFYCVSTYAYSGEDYSGVVSFRNAYGELPATQIPKLPFYGALTIVYAVIGMYVSFGDSILQFVLTLLDSGHFYTCNTGMTSVSIRSRDI